MEQKITIWGSTFSLERNFYEFLKESVPGADESNWVTVLNL